LGRESDSVVCSVEWEDGTSTIEHLNDVESLIKVNKWITPMIPDRYLASSNRYWQSHYPTRHVYALKLSEDVWKSDHSPAFPIVIGGEEFGKRIEPGEERGRLYIGETGYRFEDGKTGVERRFDVHMDPGGKYRAKVVNEHPFSRIFSDCLRDDLVFECQDGNYALGKKLSVKVECWVGWKLNMSGYAIWGPAKTDMEKYRHLGTDGWT
jgi:hypothetical protein